MKTLLEAYSDLQSLKNDKQRLQNIFNDINREFEVDINTNEQKIIQSILVPNQPITYDLNKRPKQGTVTVQDIDGNLFAEGIDYQINYPEKTISILEESTIINYDKKVSVQYIASPTDHLNTRGYNQYTLISEIIIDKINKLEADIENLENTEVGVS